MTLADRPGDTRQLAHAAPGQDGSVSRSPAHFVGRALALGAIAGCVIAVDQWTKSWALRNLSIASPRHVLGPVYLVLSFNRGAAFSLGSGASPVIEALASVLAVAVIAFSGRAARTGASRVVVVGLGLLSGGALSNLADRLLRDNHGAVVDFIQAVSWWPTFNVADAAITTGAVTVAVSLVFFSRSKEATP
jgi:signal peptidase II